MLIQLPPASVRGSKVPLGDCYTTPGFLGIFRASIESVEGCSDKELRARFAEAERNLAGLLFRHSAGDWGHVPPEDANANESELTDPAGHVLSTYHVRGERVWIETSWNGAGDRATVVMLPDER